METTSSHIGSRVPVRWPFRILAALVVLAGIATLITTGIIGWSHGSPLLEWQLLASLPGVLWLIRLTWHAAVHGKSPASPYWPFASDRVFTFYMVLWVLVSIT